MNRRHDIDTLRFLAFALVMVYHLGMAYVADWPWHLKSAHAAEWLQWPMRALNLWRLDLVFLVSGLALGLLMRRETPAPALWRQRSARLLLPLAFGMAVVVPYQAYAQALAGGFIEPGFGAFLWRYAQGGPWPAQAFDGAHVGVTWNHLWFLPYLWAYTSVLLLARRALAPLAPRFQALRGAWLMLLPLLPLMMGSLLLRRHFPPTHDLVNDWWMHAVYFTVFLYGWWIGTDAALWRELTRLRWWALGGAVLAFAAHLGFRLGLTTPWPWARLAADAVSWWAIVAALGFAHRHLNRPWPWLGWARESVYPWYVLHQTLIIVALAWLMPLGLGPVAEPLGVLTLTVLGCWALNDGLIRRVGWLRACFGLAPLRRISAPLQAQLPRQGQ
ncbi:MAG: acyltransferase family protein [Hydrogenophaga sp.]|uniref:acyltransferase family protein n=1 Tax=Hydrogenophaga sp. TaxID=1904254 RepID=UPI0016AF9271|nr:acyltransferase [Hydrogenophaga sp.]NIM41913.1 acyltransferase family protein [Hydrogenophaga sp.]NIN27216.1 acyltransferase family protein [Hydrogenophaga sp.]NIN31917.1 acyltransferase family protein [Hydrogenophaga sp.]NIN56310.1 acyltransferase family protein [Hydrogenophaga sp.]NIO52290.1 acyltransferase family protein [Hydrogenophaga sp.]